MSDDQIDPRVAQRLSDLLDNASTVARLVARGRAAYDTDEMMRFAAESLIIRLGECVDRIDKADQGFVAAHPELQLRQLKYTRNLIAHGYDIVDYGLVWSVMDTNIPLVVDQVARLLKDTD